MRMKRLNITLPDELATELKALPHISRFIAEAVRERLDQEKKKKLDEFLVEGYKATAREDGLLDAEWELATVEEKGW
jgi:metal-responsive CopG/Arc/MetJ family transcriptional regulator